MRVRLSSLIFAAALIMPVQALAATYKVDPDHTKIEFKVKHMGISYVVGHFSTFEGMVEFDPASIAASKATAKISAKTINTDNKKRDDHLRSAEFLDAAKHPEITFASKEITDVQGNKFKVKGDITIHGVTKPIVLDAEFTGAVKDPWGNDRAAFEATTTMNRKDFGLVWNKILESGGLLVGEDVIVQLHVEAVKQK